MDNQKYKEKYIKYKSKYLELKYDGGYNGGTPDGNASSVNAPSVNAPSVNASSGKTQNEKTPSENASSANASSVNAPVEDTPEQGNWVIDRISNFLFGSNEDFKKKQEVEHQNRIEAARRAKANNNKGLLGIIRPED